MPPRRRKRDIAHPAEAKPFIMGLALAVCGILEFVEGIEKGESKFKSAKKAVRRTQLRGKAIQKAAREVAPEIAKIEKEEDET